MIKLVEWLLLRRSSGIEIKQCVPQETEILEASLNLDELRSAVQAEVKLQPHAGF